VPVDVSEARSAGAEQIAATYDGVTVEAIVGDFTLHLAHLRARPQVIRSSAARSLLVEGGAFLGALADSCGASDWLLLGTDLVKDADRLIAAYDDRAASPEVRRNGLRVLNRDLRADFDVGRFTYVPFWDPHLRRMDIRLRAGRVTSPSPASDTRRRS
jgi:L-histidine N-alpha-methyltransferase